MVHQIIIIFCSPEKTLVLESGQELRLSSSTKVVTIKDIRGKPVYFS